MARKRARARARGEIFIERSKIEDVAVAPASQSNRVATVTKLVAVSSVRCELQRHDRLLTLGVLKQPAPGNQRFLDAHPCTLNHWAHRLSG